uniref:Ubiquinone biosynthesis protein n=1 Tax=Tetradesmus obliquus TaxID=3088 RepID=A0A383W6Z6_TETOB|eukprot:jgi/Sobl393_1/6069/SZX72970.1
MLRHCSTRLLGTFRAAAPASVLQLYSTVSFLESDANQLQQELLQAATKHIKQHGWSRAALLQAAKDLQLSPSAAGMFPRGPSHLVEHIIQSNNEALAAQLQEPQVQQQLAALPLPQRIAAAVRRRLELNTPYMDSWPQALAVLAQPRNSPEALRLLLQLLDEIWYSAGGDTSTDASWYTKRASLAAVYMSTELYMLTDYSPGYADTWQQLDRRMQDALWLGSAAAAAAALPQQLLSALAQAVGGARQGQPTGSSSTSTYSSSSYSSTSSSWAADAQAPTGSAGTVRAGADNFLQQAAQADISAARSAAAAAAAAGTAVGSSSSSRSA